MEETVFELIKLSFFNSKLMFVFHHGDESVDGNYINPELIKDLTENGPRVSSRLKVVNPKDKSFHLQAGSKDFRTREVNSALKSWVTNNGGIISGDLKPDPLLIAPMIFKKYNKGVKEEMELNNWTPLEALVHLDQEFLNFWKSQLSLWLISSFSSISQDKIILVPCQSPTVEALYNLFFDNVKIKFGLLEGIILVQKPNGEIIVTK